MYVALKHMQSMVLARNHVNLAASEPPTLYKKPSEEYHLQKASKAMSEPAHMYQMLCPYLYQAFSYLVLCPMMCPILCPIFEARGYHRSTSNMIIISFACNADWTHMSVQ